MYRPDKIISGGQTGADMGGLIGAKKSWDKNREGNILVTVNKPLRSI